MNKNLGPKLAFIFLLPVLLTACVLFWWGKNQNALTAQSSSPTVLEVSEVQFYRRPAPRTSTRSRFIEGSGKVDVTVFVGYKGSQPTRWRDGSVRRYLQNLKLVNHKGDTYDCGMSAQWPDYDGASQKHLLHLSSTLPKDFDLSQKGLFQGTVVFEKDSRNKASFVRFSMPIQLS